MVKTLTLAAALVVMAVGMASAQAPVQNPTTLAWEQPDYDLVSGYEVGYFLGSAAEPYWMGPIAKSAVTPVGVEYTAKLARPALGQFTAKLRATYTTAEGTAGVTAWSNSTVPFVLPPSMPANLQVR